jgi:hypothetical protein
LLLLPQEDPQELAVHFSLLHVKQHVQYTFRLDWVVHARTNEALHHACTSSMRY